MSDHPTNRTKTVSSGGELPLEPVVEGPLEAYLPHVSTVEFPFEVGQQIELPDDSEPTLGDPMERIIDEANFLPVSFLERGVEVQRAVARVVLTQPHVVPQGVFPAGTGWATGFMISPSLFLTNNHVIPNAAFAGKIRMQFNFQLSIDGLDLMTDSYFPDAADLFHTNAALDYSVIRMRPNNGVLPGDIWGFIPLTPVQFFRQRQHFNIIQHPQGRRKEIAIQDNMIEQLFTDVVRYRADTEPASSGSPVLDNLWMLVALHHAGGAQDSDGKWLNNQGIRSDRIVADLRDHFSQQPDVLTELGI